MARTFTEIDIYHRDDSTYSYPLDKNTVEVKLRIVKTLKDSIMNLKIHYGIKYSPATFSEKEMEYFGSDAVYSYYIVKLKLNDRRFSYYFTFTCDGTLYYYTEDGVDTSTYENIWQYSLFQIGYINDDDIHEEVKWNRQAIFYQIFVDRFNIGNKNKDLSYAEMKENDKPKVFTFYGGDLQGIIDKLDYLQDLGVNALYLTPIFKSTSEHKYNIADYYNVDEMFGSNETLKELVQKAHQRGMKVVLDAVFNHCAIDHPFFLDVKEKGKNSKYFSWFFVHGDELILKVDKSNPRKAEFNYEGFSTGFFMPKFNTANKEVKDYFINVATHYIKEYDIDGWRLDVADEISHTFWRDFRTEVKKAKKDALILGEVWPDAHSFLRGEQFDAVMNYPFRKCLIKYLTSDRKASFLSDGLTKCLMSHTSIVNSMMYNLIDSHDSPRFFTELGEDIDLFKMALATLFMFEGMPALYYGDEIHLCGGKDPDCRRAFPFTDFEKRNDLKFLEFVKSLIKLRKETPTLCYGNSKIYYDKELFILERYDEDNKYTLLLNNSDKSIKIPSKVSSTIDKILFSNNLKDSVMDQKSFMIFKNK